jgi:hypothetical protein
MGEFVGKVDNKFYKYFDKQETDKGRIILYGIYCLLRFALITAALYLSIPQLLSLVR